MLASAPAVEPAANPDKVMLQLLSNADVYCPSHVGLRHLLIGAGRVLWIGEELPSVDPAVLSIRHDVEGRRLIPGLIDPHVHITGGGGEAGPASKVPPMPVAS